MLKILVVEDDHQISEQLCSLLHKENFAPFPAYTQKEAMKALEQEPFDLALLDISLPDGSGYSICASIQRDQSIPVIFLTAFGDEISTVTGLDMGADDYIEKPFRPKELISRIRSVLRRYHKDGKLLRCGEITVDQDKALVKRGQEELFLSALEYRILILFMRNQGRVLSRTLLLEEIWDASGEYVNDNTLTVYIRRLRKKLENDTDTKEIIQTVRGLGYKMEWESYETRI